MHDVYIVAVGRCTSREDNGTAVCGVDRGSARIGNIDSEVEIGSSVKIAPSVVRRNPFRLCAGPDEFSCRNCVGNFGDSHAYNARSSFCDDVFGNKRSTEYDQP